MDNNEFYVVKLWGQSEDYYFRNKDNAYNWLWKLFLQYGVVYSFSEKDIELTKKVMHEDGYIWDFGEVEVVGFED